MCFALAFSALQLLAAATGFQDPPAATFGTTVVISSGLRGEVYFIHRNTKDIPDLKRHKPVGTIYTNQLNVPPHDFKQGFPGITDRYEWFAIEYTGRFWIVSPGLYRFSLLADDGAQLFIDDQLIIDNSGMHPPQIRNGSLQLSGGLHRIRVPYFQGPRYQVALVLKVARPDSDLFEVFDMNSFLPPVALDSWPQSERPAKSE